MTYTNYVYIHVYIFFSFEVGMQFTNQIYFPLQSIISILKLRNWSHTFKMISFLHLKSNQYVTVSKSTDEAVV